MNTTQIGRQAEDIAADFLRRAGFEILAQNWRTKRFEIDLVAARNGSLYVVEVKFRRNGNYGGGIEAVNDRKLRQMHFAAQCLLQSLSAESSQTQLRLMVVAVDAHMRVQRAIVL